MTSLICGMTATTLASGYGEVEEPSVSLLVFSQEMVKHPEKLQDSLLPPGVCQAAVIDHQVGIDLAIVATDEETAGGSTVLVTDLDSWHESLQNISLVMDVLDYIIKFQNEPE